jgi:hypothetical protein
MSELWPAAAREQVEKTAAAAPGCTVRHHPTPVAVYELQARVIDLQNTHKKMRLRILSSLTDRS